MGAQWTLVFGGVSDGIRTRDRRDHNPELYQLSYAHQARRWSLAMGPRREWVRPAPHRRPLSGPANPDSCRLSLP
jgi:hypothetical protein